LLASGAALLPLFHIADDPEQEIASYLQRGTVPAATEGGSAIATGTSSSRSTSVRPSTNATGVRDRGSLRRGNAAHPAAR
jgi:hypothetical protein